MRHKHLTFTIIWTVFYFLSYYLLRALLGDEGVGLLVATSVSILVSILGVWFQESPRKILLSFFLAAIYILGLSFSLICFKPRINPIENIQGHWETQEKGGDHFSLEFKEGDSLKVVIPAQSERTFKFKVNGNRLITMDEEGEVVFDWLVVLKDHQLTLVNGKEHLIFYRKQD